MPQGQPLTVGTGEGTRMWMEPPGLREAAPCREPTLHWPPRRLGKATSMSPWTPGPVVRDGVSCWEPSHCSPGTPPGAGARRREHTSICSSSSSTRVSGFTHCTWEAILENGNQVLREERELGAPSERVGQRPGASDTALVSTGKPGSCCEPGKPQRSGLGCQGSLATSSSTSSSASLGSSTLLGRARSGAARGAGRPRPWCTASTVRWLT